MWSLLIISQAGASWLCNYNSMAFFHTNIIICTQSNLKLKLRTRIDCIIVASQTFASAVKSYNYRNTLGHMTMDLIYPDNTDIFSLIFYVLTKTTDKVSRRWLEHRPGIGPAHRFQRPRSPGHEEHPGGDVTSVPQLRRGCCQSTRPPAFCVRW